MKELTYLPVPLLDWYRENARDLPWRKTANPYHIWVSEIMLQQTRVAAVLDYYRRFLAELPDIAALASVPDDRLMKLWQGLGYYSRARNLKRAARVIVETHNAVFPRDYAAIRALPGIGDYTAGAISSIAFGLPVPAVDGNVLRVVARVTGDRGDITRPDTKKRVIAGLSAVLPRDMAGAFNQAIMELGATVCLPNGPPKCEVCPAAPFCFAARENCASSLPVKALKAARRVEERVVFLIFHAGRIALRQRPARGLLAGLWEPPHELFHELFHAHTPPEEWGITPTSISGKYTGKHVFTHIEWHMTAQIVHVDCDALPPKWVWAGRDDLRDFYAIPSAFSCFFRQIEEFLRE